MEREYGSGTTYSRLNTTNTKEDGFSSEYERRLLAFTTKTHDSAYSLSSER